MFAEDRNLLPRDLFISCLDDCLKGESSYDVLGGLFHAMNQLGKIPAGRYRGVDYFNGGLFSKIHPIELTKDELKFLTKISLEDWGKVRPAIFGGLFKSTQDKKERQARGIHFTSEADIMKVVRPTISRYWEEKIEQATTLTIELRNYRVLDPACGLGNFLYIAYQELKRIELWLLDKISQRQRKEDKQLEIGFVTPLQFYGMDTNLFAVELAKVTMAIARKIAIDNLELTETALPLDTLDNNIVCQDALFNQWQQADAIIGNPPFLGGKHMKTTLGDNYVNRIFNKFPDVKDSVDICTYWFTIAHDNINENGRAGLVGTNSISQGKSRNASLNYIVKNNGYIHEAISTQPWSGEAKVHVSIVNWSKKESKRCYLDNQLVQSIKMIDEKLAAILEKIQSMANPVSMPTAIAPVSTPAATEPVPALEPAPTPTPVPEPKPVLEKNWAEVTTEELRGKKIPGSAEEKIKRTVQAIFNYNDYSAPSNNERWFLGVRSIQDLSGCNYAPIKKFVDDYSTMIADHNAKYGLSNQHNKKHIKAISEIITKW
ncbi:MAG: N-6 DNA methylase [Rhizonema sp. PD37]|nr:N-6 DNA methylase [Rhizonema sp. PD37]